MVVRAVQFEIMTEAGRASCSDRITMRPPDGTEYKYSRANDAICGPQWSYDGQILSIHAPTKVGLRYQESPSCGAQRAKLTPPASR